MDLIIFPEESVIREELQKITGGDERWQPAIDSLVEEAGWEKNAAGIGFSVATAIIPCCDNDPTLAVVLAEVVPEIIDALVKDPGMRWNAKATYAQFVQPRA